jgi:SAM-dependent methyltransferase
MINPKSPIYQAGMKISDLLGEPRTDEYGCSLKWLRESQKVLDVACGTGTFLESRKGDTVGVDLNPQNVDYCVKKGLNARVGDALSIPFPDSSFDGVHCSHLMQVFGPKEAAQCIRELGRVVKPGGIVVIVTLNWFKRFFRHPENARPYPPDAIRRYFNVRQGTTSPMFPNLPRFEQEAIWLRRPSLVEFYSSTNYLLDEACLLINRLQYKLFLRKYWAYDAYSIKLRCCKD